MTKIQASAKQHAKDELYLLENLSHSSSMLSSKNIRTYSQTQTKEQVCLFSWDYTNHMENRDGNEIQMT